MWRIRVALVIIACVAPDLKGPAYGKGAAYVCDDGRRADLLGPAPQQPRNPVAPTPQSIARGAAHYGKLCAHCHGPYGLGNGRLATGMEAYGARPSNLTDREWRHGSSDGEIFLVVRDGIGPEFHMPRFAGKLTDPAIWDVVNFIRTLGI
jgi:mono/diheme cytochrome c family protein